MPIINELNCTSHGLMQKLKKERLISIAPAIQLRCCQPEMVSDTNQRFNGLPAVRETEYWRLREVVKCDQF
ncbi:hypothetical protein B5X24_HaOG206508 [Helicoverpa armigera]|uniref:Uncharacterized protein n=1 Tax=Helicoverpa armigera TaxID=29058 RepID=A0A2W1BRG5_HELAM|nr:hypothetical protein B5X24_HaOG206508 [Helicoverpa armigera]